MRNIYKIHLLETKYVKMAQMGLNIDLRKKFQGMEFKDFYELATKVMKYEELLKEENQWRKTSMGTYCQEVNFEEVIVAYLLNPGSFTCPLLVKKTPDFWKKSQASNTHVHYTFDVAKTKEIFDFLLKDKFIAFPQDYQLPYKDELIGKMYCKYHNSWNRSANSCWSFRNIIQDRIIEGILKFLEKKEAMVIDEDPFPPIASINIAATDLSALLNAKKAGRFSPSARIRKTWIPKKYLVHMDDLVARKRVAEPKKRKKMEGIHIIHLKIRNKKSRRRNSQRERCFSKRETCFSN